MKILRSITGYTLFYDKKTNEEIRSTCGITNITKWIKQRRQGWKDHVNRMSENRLPKLAMTFEPDTPRPVGRPPTRWKQKELNYKKMRQLKYTGHSPKLRRRRRLYIG
ncbi:hypothetical protein C0J52_21659 [Blattella germanica]|nr:hypothetical protein C0J52_21659 [Blattella germanica]